MQIVGLNNLDYHANVDRECFGGLEVYNKDSVTVSLSDKPLINFTEYNVSMKDMDDIDLFAGLLA